MKAENHYNLTSSKVYKLTIEVMKRLPLIAESIRAELMVSVLIFAAAFRISVNQSCSVLKGVPSGVTILSELADNYTDLESLEIKYNRNLLQLLRKGLRKRKRQVAIDLVKTPYHGTVEAEFEEEIVRSEAESGTTHFFMYATAYAIVAGRRYTLAMYRVRAGEKMLDVLKKLLGRLREIGIKMSLLLIDRGFYSVAVINYLITLCQPFIMPAKVQGKKATADCGATATRALAELKSSRWTTYTMESQSGEQATFDMAVVCCNRNGKRNRHGRETLLYATWGVKHRPLIWVKETYRKRFGIESSYRQMHQARIKTSTRNPVLRYLFIAIALMLRNIWVWLHSEVIAQPNKGRRIALPSALRFQHLLLWLLSEVTSRFKLLKQIDVPIDIFDAAKDFGIY